MNTAQPLVDRADCLNCAEAACGDHWGFTQGCVMCLGRSIARSPQFFEARTTGQQSRRYRALLEQFGVTHQQVLDAAAADALKPRKG